MIVVTAIGALSLALYLAVDVTQRDIFLNGLDLTAAGVRVQGVPWDLDRLLRDLAGYELLTLGLFALYVWILVLCGRGRLIGAARMAALVVPLSFHLALVATRPHLSLDVFSYLAYGAQAAVLGGDPYAATAIDVAGTPYGQQLISFGWRPGIPVSPYGPLWTALEIGVVRVTQDVTTGVLLLKTLVVAASLASAALIWAILGRVRPADQLLGTLAYLWNPMIVMELAGEGHNDALMIVLVLAGLFFAVRWRSGPAIVALGLAVLVKYLPVVLALPQVVLFWRDRPRRAEHLRSSAVGTLVATAIASLLFAPFWIGPATFAGVRTAAEATGVFASTSGALLAVLRDHLAPDAAARLATVVAVGVFVTVVIAVSARVRDPRSMLWACASVSLAYIFIATPYFWPWHAALPVTLMALSPSGVFRWMIVVLSAGSRVVAPLDDMFANGFIPLRAQATLTFLIAIALPLLALLVLWLRARAREVSSGGAAPAA